MKTTKWTTRWRLLAALVLPAPMVTLGFAQTEPSRSGVAVLGAPAREVTFEECLQLALQNNRRRPASQFAVAMAEAQHRQALAAYWPQVTARAAVERKDEAPNYIFPSRSFAVPAQTISIPMGGTIPVTVPGFGTVPLGEIRVPAQTMSIPPQEVTLQDRDSAYGSIGVNWLLYDGGMRRGYREQGRGQVDMMKADARRTELEIGDSVKRLYFGAVLARQIHQVGQDTLTRMEATLQLTETMYRDGGGKVKKTDWLETKVMVASLRAMIARLEQNETMAQSALANTIGYAWDVMVKPADREVPYTPTTEGLDQLVGNAYRFNPDWEKLEAAIRAVEGGLRTAKSGYHPKVALVGGVHKWWNELKVGMATDQNKEGWSVGLGIEVPIFNGLLTQNKVAEVRARLGKIKEEQFLLKDGIGLLIKETFLGLAATKQAHEATREAMQAAGENRELTTRAYAGDLVETEKVIRAQYMEAFMTAQHYLTRYEYVALQSRLSLQVGTEVLKRVAAVR